jgi:hypothetical protein
MAAQEIKMKESFLGQVTETVVDEVNDERVAEMSALIPDR